MCVLFVKFGCIMSIHPTVVCICMLVQFAILFVSHLFSPLYSLLKFVTHLITMLRMHLLFRLRCVAPLLRRVDQQI